MDVRIARRRATDKAKPLCIHEVPIDEMIEEGLEAAEARLGSFLKQSFQILAGQQGRVL